MKSGACHKAEVQLSLELHEACPRLYDKGDSLDSKRPVALQYKAQTLLRNHRNQPPHTDLAMRSRPHRVSRRANGDVLPSAPPILKLSHDTVALVRLDFSTHLREQLQLLLTSSLQICDLLLPVDVLSLYRSCKAIRTFLRLKTSKPLWKIARANVEGLPECPEWLTEPQFVSLCFEEFCTRCLTTDPYSRSSIWPFGVRYCLSCRNAL